jgi:hypothetical protein
MSLATLAAGTLLAVSPTQSDSIPQGQQVVTDSAKTLVNTFIVNGNV